LNKNLGLPLILIAFGALIILNRFGIHLLGPIMGYIVPIAMVALGYLGIKNGSKFGWIIAGIGAIILLGKLAGWLVIVLAIGLILYGLSMLKKSPQA
jgi:predicted membrane protein